MTLVQHASTPTPADLQEFVDSLVHIGRTWAGTLPADLTDTSIRRRVRGAGFSAIVVIDGDGDPGPVRLSPKDRPEIDLGGLSLHEVDDPASLDDADQRRLLTRIRRVVDAHAGRTGPAERVIGRFLSALCCVLAAHYELRLLDADDVPGADIAPALPVAFAAAWERPLPVLPESGPIDLWPVEGIATGADLLGLPPYRALSTEDAGQASGVLTSEGRVTCSPCRTWASREHMASTEHADMIARHDTHATTTTRPPAVPAELRPWHVPLEDYAPVDVTLPELAGWTDPEPDPDDPTGLDWESRQSDALVPFEVHAGWPRHPAGRTGRTGRQIERWGENAAADPVVVATVHGRRWVLLIRRSDAGLWAIPGGMVEQGETDTDTLVRELWEETGIDLADLVPQIITRRLAGDPRDTDDAWIATTVGLFRLNHRPEPMAGSDAADARWWPLDSVHQLDNVLRQSTGAGLYPPHPALLQACLDAMDSTLGHRDRPAIRARLEGELATVRAELVRADAKASTLLGLAGVLLGGGLAVLTGAGLPGPAAVAAWSGAAVLLLAAVVLLASAVRPNLSGHFGFVRWAASAHPVDVVAELSDAAGPLVEHAGQLRWLSRALHAKYARVRHAVHLLLCGLAGAAVAAALTAWTR